MTIHELRPAPHTPADTLPGASLRTTLAVCRWWSWALRTDCSGEWDHTISRLIGAIAFCEDDDTRATLRFLRDLAVEHSERCYHAEQSDIAAMMDDLTLLRPQAD